MQLSRKGIFMMKHLLLISILFSLALFASTPVVTVSIAPQKYFVEQIAKGLVNVNIMVTPGSSPHTYEPKPTQMKQLAHSDVYFRVGDGFENAWLPKFQSINPKMLIVDTSKDVKKIAMIEPLRDESTPAQVEDDDDGGLDPHIWLDPIMVKVQAKTILDTLNTLYPLHVKEFNANYEVFMHSLDTLDSTIRDTLSGLKNRKFIVFHPAFGYFAKRYNLEQVAIEVSGKEPKPAELAMIIKEAKQEGTNVVFVAPEFSQKSAQTIAKQIGGKTIIIDPLASKWKENLLLIAQTFQSALK